jgi:hypothetical protein
MIAFCFWFVTTALQEGIWKVWNSTKLAGWPPCSTATFATCKTWISHFSHNDCVPIFKFFLFSQRTEMATTQSVFFTTAVLPATSSYTCPFRHDKWSQVFVSMGSATLAVYPILCYQQQLAYSLNFAVLLCHTSRNDELAHTRTRLYRHRFIHLAYSIWYSVLPTKSSLLTKPLYISVKTTHLCNMKILSFHDAKTARL